MGAREGMQAAEQGLLSSGPWGEVNRPLLGVGSPEGCGEQLGKWPGVISTLETPFWPWAKSAGMAQGRVQWETGLAGEWGEA